VLVPTVLAENAERQTGDVAVEAWANVELAPESEISNLKSEIIIEPLSERELQVLRLLAAGLSNPEIARQLYVAVSTIRPHAKSIYGKLNVHGRWEAVQRAKELRLL